MRRSLALGAAEPPEPEAKQAGREQRQRARLRDLDHFACVEVAIRYRSIGKGTGAACERGTAGELALNGTIQVEEVAERKRNVDQDRTLRRCIGDAFQDSRIASDTTLIRR